VFRLMSALYIEVKVKLPLCTLLSHLGGMVF
jgi:hypothetical protein